MPRGGTRLGSGRKKLPEGEHRIKACIVISPQAVSWAKGLGGTTSVVNTALNISHKLIENEILMQTLEAIALSRGIAIGELIEVLLIQSVTE